MEVSCPSQGESQNRTPAVLVMDLEYIRGSRSEPSRPSNSSKYLPQMDAKSQQGTTSQSKWIALQNCTRRTPRVESPRHPRVYQKREQARGQPPESAGQTTSNIGHAGRAATALPRLRSYTADLGRRAVASLVSANAGGPVFVLIFRILQGRSRIPSSIGVFSRVGFLRMR